MEQYLVNRDKIQKDSTPPQKRQVFVIRIWSEPREWEDEQPQMRGVIEHIATGSKRYFLELSEVNQFIYPFVREMGIKKP